MGNTDIFCQATNEGRLAPDASLLIDRIVGFYQWYLLYILDIPCHTGQLLWQLEWRLTLETCVVRANLRSGGILNAVLSTSVLGGVPVMDAGDNDG